MTTKRSVLFLFLLFTCSLGFSQQIYQWRGTSRNGIYQEKQLLKSWPEKGPELLWTSDSIGHGYGSPVITPDMLYVNGEVESISHLFAYDLTGKLLWKSPNGMEFMGQGFSSKFPGSRSAPTVVDDVIYVCSGNGRIACFEKKTGKEKWAKEMIRDLKGIMPNFGYSESLVTDKNNVYCFPGGVDTNIVALNRITGKIVWVSKAMGDTASYNSPMIISLPARDILVTFSNNYLMGLDTKTGELLWSHKQENVRYKQQCNTPIFDNGAIYYIAGDGNGAVKLDLSSDGKTIKEVWRNNNVKNNFNGFVKLNDYLISSDRSVKLKILNCSTGQVIDTIKVNKGALIAADGMLFCYSDNGEVNLIRLTGAKMEVVSKFKIEKGTNEHFAHPVISKGILYIRHGKLLMAYNIKEK